MTITDEMPDRVQAALAGLVESCDDAALWVDGATVIRRVASKLRSTPKAVGDHVRDHLAAEYQGARCFVNGRETWLGVRWRVCSPARG